MANLIQAVRGMNDILPDESPLWHHAEYTIRRILKSHGYQEIRTPIVEKTELFKRSIGEVTDIVEKEMYTFLDRNNESLSLRPEGTASCVRAGIEHGLFYNQIQRLWYTGPNFRYEKPQKGRYRQFYQYSAEVFGLAGPDIDAELIIMSASILDKLALAPFVTLEINSLGSPASRLRYREALVSYFTRYQKDLDDDSQHRLHRNPLRILDSKNPAMRQLVAGAPKLLDSLDGVSAAHFDKLQDYLQHAGVKFEINPRLVRGLDYYTNTVFEWTTQKLGAQGAICSGGRYDGLVEQLGGRATPAIGFAFGLERTVLLMQQSGHNYLEEPPIHAYVISDGENAFISALKLANYLRSKVHGLRMILHAGGGSIKSQFKKADKSGAVYALVIGEHELKTRSVTLKHLRKDIPQQTLYQDELAEYFKLNLPKRS